MATLQNRKPKGLTGLAVFDKSTDPETMYVVDTPGTAELDPGIEELISETRSELGELVVESVEIDAQRPIITTTFPGLTPELLALRFGRKLTTETDTFNIEKRIRLTATNNVKAAALTGREGYGMAADQAASVASVLEGLGVSTVLTRVTHATFDPAVTDDSFSQGADGAYKFSENLIGSDVVFSFPHSLSVTKLGEDPLSDLRLNFTIVMKDLKLFRVEIPSASVSRQDSGAVPLGTGEVEIQWRVTYDGSTCTPISFKWIDQARAC